jgi:hypothetical protein
LTKTDGGFSGDWEGLYSFDLRERTHLKIADKDSLRFPSPYVEGWVTSLVDVSADASELYLTVGMNATRYVGRISNGQPPIGTDGFADRQFSSHFSFEGDVLLGVSTCLGRQIAWIGPD